LGKLLKAHLILIIDNCFATPYLQPIKWGALGCTFCHDGQGRVLGGVTGEPELIKKYIYFPDLPDLPYPFNGVLSKV
jgi:O-succinylhomoserine sulfhydrylase